MDVKEESLLGAYVSQHWYYVSKGKALLNVLKNKQFNEIVDVGAGSGIFSKVLIDAGVCEKAICVDPAYEKKRIEHYNNHDIIFTQSLQKMDQNLILMIDVLEHVDDDLGLLESYTTHFQKEDYVLISVPAFKWLWSGHDIFLEHKRRYTLPQVKSLVHKANLKIVKCNYFFATLFPIVALLRLTNNILVSANRHTPKSDLKKYPRLINKLLIFIHSIEAQTIFRFNRVAGLSILCLAKKQ